MTKAQINTMATCYSYELRRAIPWWEEADISVATLREVIKNNPRALLEVLETWAPDMADDFRNDKRVWGARA